MDDRSIASRLVTYSDALVGMTVVGASGLSLALLDPDNRCSLTSAVFPISMGSLIFAAGVIMLLIILRRWELDLLEGTSESEKAMKYSNRLHVARLVAVSISAIATVVFLVAAGGDPTCRS